MLQTLSRANNSRRCSVRTAPLKRGALTAASRTGPHGNCTRRHRPIPATTSRPQPSARPSNGSSSRSKVRTKDCRLHVAVAGVFIALIVGIGATYNQSGLVSTGGLDCRASRRTPT
ncbi:hypothetical protein C9J85_11560 [Haloferax sp. wsp5]|nr:hypothetical protein C9J85_11560 [Haloferax sp. wsp5]